MARLDLLALPPPPTPTRPAARNPSTMAAASSPGSRLEAKSASVLGQLSQANREWSEAYHRQLPSPRSLSPPSVPAGCPLASRC